MAQDSYRWRNGGVNMDMKNPMIQHAFMMDNAEYKGAYIVYSLGNFINGNSDVGEDTFIFQKDFCMDQGVVVSLGEGRIIPVLTSPDMTKNTFLPTLASGADEKRILDRIYTAGKTIPGGITE